MTERPIHLRNGLSYTGNNCRQTWDSVAFPDGPDPVTEELSEVTCKPCQRWLIEDGICPECGSRWLAWDSSPVKLQQISEGRLNTRDIETQFHLGCRECSATLIHSITPDQVAVFLTEKKFRP